MFFLVDFLDPGVWDCSSTVSSVGAGVGAGAGAGMSAGAGTSAMISSLSSDSENREAEAVSDLSGGRDHMIFYQQNCAQHSF